MGLSPRQAAELHELLWQLRAGTAAPEQLSRLERLVCEDPQARTFYVHYMHLCADLNWNGSVGSEGRGTRDGGQGMAGSPAIDASVDANNLSVGEAVELPSGQWPRTLNPEPPVSPIVIDLSSTTHYPLPTSHFSVGSWAFSCMVSAVIMGMMLLVFWAIKVTPHQHIAEAPSQSAPSKAMPEMVFVGRITGMVDVKWSDDPRYLPPPDFAHVPLDRKYILDSGLLEITYDSGAKVILEGPCTYEVESTGGGYLALGKLTARVEAGGGKGSRSQAEPSSFILHPSSLFSVRTPTAIITDLGPEVGVEVDESGVSKAHVFQGKVEVRLAGGGRDARAIQLGANESARVEHGKDAEDRLVIVRGPALGKPPRFVRSLRPKPVETVRIVEKFTDGKLGAAFEQNPPGRYAIVPGAAVYQQQPTDNGRQPRGYIRTVATDFCDRDFTFEATFQVSEFNNYIFFGLGDGVPNANYWDVVTCGLVLDFVPVSGGAFVRFYHPFSDSRGIGDAGRIVTEVAPSGRLGPGRHRFRMSKVGKWVRFAVDADFEGEFQQDFVSRSIHLLAAGPPLLDATNSRLLVGTSYCDTMTVRFEELSITYTVPGKEGTPVNGP